VRSFAKNSARDTSVGGVDTAQLRKEKEGNAPIAQLTKSREGIVCATSLKRKKKVAAEALR